MQYVQTWIKLNDPMPSGREQKKIQQISNFNKIDKNIIKRY